MVTSQEQVEKYAQFYAGVTGTSGIVGGVPSGAATPLAGRGVITPEGETVLYGEPYIEVETKTGEVVKVPKSKWTPRMQAEYERTGEVKLGGGVAFEPTKEPQPIPSGPPSSPVEAAQIYMVTGKQWDPWRQEWTEPSPTPVSPITAPKMILPRYPTGQATAEVETGQAYIPRRREAVYEEPEAKIELISPPTWITAPTRKLKTGEVAFTGKEPTIFEEAATGVVEFFGYGMEPLPEFVTELPTYTTTGKAEYVLLPKRQLGQQTLISKDFIEMGKKPRYEFFGKAEQAAGLGLGVVSAPIHLAAIPSTLPLIGKPIKLRTKYPLSSEFKKAYPIGVVAGEYLIATGIKEAAPRLQDWLTPDIKPLKLTTKGEIGTIERFRFGDTERFITKGEFVKLYEGEAFVWEDIGVGEMGKDLIADIRGTRVKFLGFGEAGEELLATETVLGKGVDVSRLTGITMPSITTEGYHGKGAIKFFGGADKTRISHGLTGVSIYSADVSTPVRYAWTSGFSESKVLEDLMKTADVEPSKLGIMTLPVDKKGIFKVSDEAKRLFGLGYGEELIATTMPVETVGISGVGKITAKSLTKPISVGGGGAALFKPTVDLGVGGAGGALISFETPKWALKTPLLVAGVGGGREAIAATFKPPEVEELWTKEPKTKVVLTRKKKREVKARAKRKTGVSFDIKKTSALALKPTKAVSFKRGLGRVTETKIDQDLKQWQKQRQRQQHKQKQKQRQQQKQMQKQIQRQMQEQVQLMKTLPAVSAITKLRLLPPPSRAPKRARRRLPRKKSPRVSRRLRRKQGKLMIMPKADWLSLTQEEMRLRKKAKHPPVTLLTRKEYVRRLRSPRAAVMRFPTARGWALFKKGKKAPKKKKRGMKLLGKRKGGKKGVKLL